MALSADSRPHFTTIAAFIARLGDPIVSVFRDVLLVCDEMGLIGREMFAVDGVKLPSNASKEWSGTQRRLRQEDREDGTGGRASGQAPPRGRCEWRGHAGSDRARAKQLDTLEAALAKVRGFLRCHEDQVGARRTSEEVEHHRPRERQDEDLQGRDPGLHRGGGGRWQAPDRGRGGGLRRGPGAWAARADARAHARGVSRARSPRRRARRARFVTADAGFPHRCESSAYLERNRRRRAMSPTRCSGSATRALRRPSGTSQRASPTRTGCFGPEDFQFDATTRRTCICPAGKRLYSQRLSTYRSERLTGR